MPGISGTTLAPKQARFGVARFGASRFGDYYPCLRIYINGVDRTRLVNVETIQIFDRLNQAPNTCQFTMREGTSAPVEFQSLIISLGNATDYSREFGGFIIRVKQLQAVAGQEITYLITAKDYTWKLDKRLVSATYTGSATTVARAIRSDWTDLTADHVEEGLASIDELQLTNVRPSTALTRLANLLDPPAQWFVDYHGELRFFQTTSGLGDPPTLQSSNKGFWDFAADGDGSQVRTRAIIEGPRTRTLIAVPAGAVSFPIEDGGRFYGAGSNTTSTRRERIRLGRELFTLDYLFATDPLLNVMPAISPPYRQEGLSSQGVLDADVPAGSTSLTFLGTPVNQTSWARVGDAIFNFDVHGPSGFGTTLLNNIPASGYGSIQQDLTAGSVITLVDSIRALDDWGLAVTEDHEQGEEVVFRLEVDDTVSAAAVAAVEGGDGYHEVLIQDGRISFDSMYARALAEFAALGSAIKVITYTTRHQTVRSGRTQAVNQAGINDSFVIREVEVGGFDQLAPRTVHNAKKFPIRKASAAPVRLGSFMDQLIDGEEGL